MSISKRLKEAREEADKAWREKFPDGRMTIFYANTCDCCDRTNSRCENLRIMPIAEMQYARQKSGWHTAKYFGTKKTFFWASNKKRKKIFSNVDLFIKACANVGITITKEELCLQSNRKSEKNLTPLKLR